MDAPSKRSPLPWFAFEVAGYLKDTMRLTTESHGAYLLLMLDYYATGEPCPDDDDILAAVAKLPVEAWKTKHRKVLTPFFTIRDGRWFHNRIEREMEEAMLKHSLAIARAHAGADARWGSKARKPATKAVEMPEKAQSVAVSSQNDAPAVQQAMQEAMPKQSLEDAHLHLHTKTLSLQEPIGSEEKVPEGIGSTIPHNFRPPPAVMGKLLDEADAATIHIEIQKFIFHHREQGTWSHDWESTFGKWWARFVEHQKKNAKPKAAPRIEVNAEPNWEWHVSRFAKNQSMWSKRSCGPEPGQIGCRAPREVLLAHHIDPATGHIIRETTP